MMVVWRFFFDEMCCDCIGNFYAMILRTFPHLACDIASPILAVIAFLLLLFIVSI